jgi:mono/diheme cytochrome c family protein
VRFTWFLLGAFSAVAIAMAVGIALLGGAHGFSAREQPGGLERWVAQHAWSTALPADARSRANPIQNSPEILDEARAHWADHCAGCHANDGSGDTLMGKSLYPPAPDMRLAETQQKSDGALFFIIQNGIRLTGMPAWGGSGESGHDEQDSWKLVHFIRHLPQLTPEEKKQMEKLNPKSPNDLREEQEEEKFLNGDDSHEATHEAPAEHHHH